MLGKMKAAHTSQISVVELRQYTLRPNQRDALIELFDREFVEPQEEVGALLIGQFRDLDEPGRFVWLRGFPDMEMRAAALSGFYGGPVWRANRDAANATMIDSDNVLLLRPATPDSGFVLDGLSRDGSATSTTISGAVYSFDAPVDQAFIDEFYAATATSLAAAGASVLASFVTETAENNFPALPVREGENVFVFFARVPDERYAAYANALEDAANSGAISQRLRLLPTSRSLLR